MTTANFCLTLLAAILALGCQNTPTDDSTEISIPAAQYLKHGREISQLAQSVLMGNLIGKIAETGPAGAVQFCNIHAGGITDSLSLQFNSKIERVALKYRNPKNAPADHQEITLLNYFLESSLEGEILKDSLVIRKDSVIYYQPILIAMEVCTKCHGIPGKDIDDETSAVIYKHYPKDRAKGFSMDDFRGAWRVTFKD